MLWICSSDDEDVIKRRLEAKLVADLIEGKESRRRHKGKTKHKLRKRCVMCQVYVVTCVHRKERTSESSPEEEEEEEEEGGGVWVEKAIQQDGDAVFVGPVPEIKVQATMNNKE